MDDKIRSVVTVIMIAGFGWLLLRTGLSKPHRRQRVVYGWCAALDRDTMMCTIYERRPLICREFEMGAPECLEERQGIATAYR